MASSSVTSLTSMPRNLSYFGSCTSKHWHVLLLYCASLVWYCRCDEVGFDGTKRPSDEVRATYGTAQKMRASMTYAFGRLHGLGTMHWQENLLDGSMMGNPSVSELVSRYMLSLRRRKVKAGETTTSARAISAVRHLLFWERLKQTDMVTMI